MISILKNIDTNNREVSEYLDRKSVIKELNISESTFTRFCNNENFPKIKVNRKVIVKRDDMNNWLENYKTLTT